MQWGERAKFLWKLGGFCGNATYVNVLQWIEWIEIFIRF